MPSAGDEVQRRGQDRREVPLIRAAASMLRHERHAHPKQMCKNDAAHRSQQGYLCVARAASAASHALLRRPNSGPAGANPVVSIAQSPARVPRPELSETSAGITLNVQDHAHDVSSEVTCASTRSCPTAAQTPYPDTHLG